MASDLNNLHESITRELREDGLWKMPMTEPQVVYRAVPYHEPAHGGPAWRVRFELVHDPSRCLGLVVNGEVRLGRDKEAAGLVSLNAYDAASLGVSRQHALLRPTDTHLYLLDLNSTNGTWQNDHSIGVNMPYRLTHGDRIRFGQLEFVVKIVKRPQGATAKPTPNVNAFEALMPMAQAITSQLDFDEVLNQALEIVMATVSADEASVWLVDEHTGELFLEASRGIHDEHIKRLRLPVTDTLPGMAIEAGKPIQVNNASGGDKVKVKTGYLVDAVIYIPLILGGVAFGVLSAAHRKPGRLFSPDDERLLAAVAGLTAVAVQNSRLHQAATRALSHQTKMVTALNYALASDLKNQANSVIGYADLLSTDTTLNKDSLEIAQKISAYGNQMVKLMGQLLEVSTLGEGGTLPYAPVNLALTVRRAIRDIELAARDKAVQLDFTWSGEVYLIRGDATRLYHSARALLNNALKYAPPGTSVQIELDFRKNDLSLRVRDAGPAIVEDALPHELDNYERNGQTSDGQASLELGLALVRATAEAHRGTVSAQNLGGQGVVFTITLPATLRLPASGGLSSSERL